MILPSYFDLLTIRMVSFEFNFMDTIFQIQFTSSRLSPCLQGGAVAVTPLQWSTCAGRTIRLRCSTMTAATNASGVGSSRGCASRRRNTEGKPCCSPTSAEVALGHVLRASAERNTLKRDRPSMDTYDRRSSSAGVKVP